MNEVSNHEQCTTDEGYEETVYREPKDTGTLIQELNGPYSFSLQNTPAIQQPVYNPTPKEGQDFLNIAHPHVIDATNPPDDILLCSKSPMSQSAPATPSDCATSTPSDPHLMNYLYNQNGGNFTKASQTPQMQIPQMQIPQMQNPQCAPYLFSSYDATKVIEPSGGGVDNSEQDRLSMLQAGLNQSNMGYQQQQPSTTWKCPDQSINMLPGNNVAYPYAMSPLSYIINYEQYRLAMLQAAGFNQNIMGYQQQPSTTSKIPVAQSINMKLAGNNTAYPYAMIGSTGLPAACTGNKRDLDLSSDNNGSSCGSLNMNPCNKRPRTSSATSDGSYDAGLKENNPLLEKELQDLRKKLGSSKPRKPLTGYNFFFSAERERILFSIPSPNAENAKKNSLYSSKTKDNEQALVDLKKQLAEAPEQSEKDAAELNKIIYEKTKLMLNNHLDCKRTKRVHKKNHGKISFRLLCFLVGERWRDLPMDKRAKYNALAKQDSYRYNLQMNELVRTKKRIIASFAESSKNV